MSIIAASIYVRYTVPMNSKTTLSITDARKQLFDIATDVQTPGTAYTLTSDGRPKAVIMSAQEFESWQETLEVLAEIPNMVKLLAEADQAYRDGSYKQWPSLTSIKRDMGLATHVKETPKKKYVRGTTKTISKKRTRAIA